jgi:competence protein CoiA
MKYAQVNGQRQEAGPGILGSCLNCGRPMVAKCGEIKIWHWAHRGIRLCDPWWENETEWHRAWKAAFPESWQEVGHEAPGGEKHIADIKTEAGWVLEFQHSHIDPQERDARNAFYINLVWVVDGQRRKRDKAQFVSAVGQRRPIHPQASIFWVSSTESMLVRDWAGGRTPVFLDFGPEERLWCLIPSGHDGGAYVGPFSRASFIDIHRAASTQTAQNFGELIKSLSGLVSDYHNFQIAKNQASGNVSIAPSIGRHSRFHRRF